MARADGRTSRSCLAPARAGLWTYQSCGAGQHLEDGFYNRPLLGSGELLEQPGYAALRILVLIDVQSVEVPSHVAGNVRQRRRARLLRSTGCSACGNRFEELAANFEQGTLRVLTPHLRSVMAQLRP
jgi:hypothetical protein